MSVVVVGLNHRSAPLEILERVAVQPDDLVKCLAGLVLRDNISESVIVSTCMRTEIYVVAERFHGAMSDIIEFLADTAGVTPDELSENIYSYYDAAAVTHLFRVAAGLDSAVLGEGEVLGQVRDAWEEARLAGSSGPVLNGLFRHAAEVGKRARSETSISKGITSIPQAALALASAELGERLAGCRVLVVGAGTIGSSVAISVASSWTPKSLTVASRTLASASALCNRIAGGGPGDPDDLSRSTRDSITTVDAVTTGEIDGHLAAADVVFCAVTSPDPVVSASTLEGALRARGGRHLVLVDLGLPRNVEPQVGALDGVTLLDIDAVRHFAERGVSGRMAEANSVMEIIEEEYARYAENTSARQAAPLVTTLRDRAEEVRAAEFARYSRRLAGLDDRERSAVEALTRAIIAKVLHEPTVRLKGAAGTARGERLGEALRDLFDL